jgi:hypothetical protein
MQPICCRSTPGPIGPGHAHDPVVEPWVPRLLDGSDRPVAATSIVFLGSGHQPGSGCVTALTESLPCSDYSLNFKRPLRISSWIVLD